jgi:proline iminopeptidase/L-proline amide hydrolase
MADMPAIDRRTLLALFGASLCASSAFARSMGSIPLPDREAMVPVEGGRVYVRVNGDLAGARPPLLMIHGGPGGSHTAFLPALQMASARPIILYDQLDCGRSDRPGDPKNWTVRRFVDEVDAIRAYFKIEHIHILGASWGGTVALEYGARHPKGLRSLILASPLISTRSWLSDAAILREELPVDVRNTLSACELPKPPAPESCQTATDAFYKAFNRREVAFDEVKTYLTTMPTTFSETLYRTMWGASEFVSTGTLRDYDGEPLLKRLTSPTLFLAGQYDEARPGTVAAFARRVKGAQFDEIANSAHGLFNDRPEETCAVVAKFIGRHEKS